MNSHITGLAVARSLGRAGVPVVGLDDEPGGLGQHSRHLTALLHCPSPTTDGGRALAEHRDLLEPAYRFPFARAAVLRATLAKTDLYRAAELEGVAVPRSWYLDGVPLAELPSSALLDEVAGALPYPCVLKPDDSRGFYRDYGAKVLMVDGPEQLRRQVAGTAARVLRMVAQEIVAPPPGGFFSVCSYLDAAGRARGVFVGRKLEQYPPGFGTSCLVDAFLDPDDPEPFYDVLSGELNGSAYACAC